MNKLPPLTIVPASAGSGKTHYIQETLAHEIKENGLAPERIVAVTFTEAAAAELRGRIRTALVNADMLEQALRLDQAYISTIHGFGLRLLTEFAFDAGIAPKPRMLNEDEQDMLISRSLASSGQACAMMEELDRYGYRFDFTSAKTAEDSFRENLLRFIGTLRSIGKDAGGEAFIPDVERKIRELYGVTEVAAHLKGALLVTVEALLREFPRNMADGCNLGKTVEPKVRQNYFDLREAAKGDPLDTDWNLWNRLGKLHVYKSKSPFPPGYDELARAVIEAAERLPEHPGPLADALDHARALLLAATETLGDYAEHKTARGLVDYTDMLAQAHQLLCGRPDVIANFRERVGCLVIDEFQDTNPLQFAMLWALTRQGVPTIVVGDLKQAIMGFQGADARLMATLIEQHPANLDPRTTNYRSSPPLLAWVNQVAAGLFPDYRALTANADFSSTLAPLEIILAQVNLKNDVCASHTVARLHTLLNDAGQQVYDKRLKCHRRLRGGDIAILCPTNKRLEYYAAALRMAGIRCRLEQDGWLESRVVQLACYGLTYVADPGDMHAALSLAVIGPGPHDMQSALDELVHGRDLSDPYLDALRTLAGACADWTIDIVLERVIAVLNLYGDSLSEENQAQARANLLRLQQECRDFGGANRDALACGGYYGRDAKTFLAWLRDRVKRDNKQPDAAVIDEDAVQLTTWHRSKGKEWPVVAVCGTDGDYAPRLPATRADCGQFTNLDVLLEQATVEIFPDFVAAKTREKFEDHLFEDNREGALRLLYVALTRAREKAIIEWPEYQANKDGCSYWRLLVEKAGLTLAGNTMKVGSQQFPCGVYPAGKEPWVIEPIQKDASALRFGRPAITPGCLPTGLTPDAITPSGLHGREIQEERPVLTVRYAEPLVCDFPGLEPTERGTLLHRAFEILGGQPQRRAFLKDAVGGRLDDEQTGAIAGVVAAFDRWLTKELGATDVRAELPILVLDEQGSVVTGTVDLVVETPDGYWIIDHKSDQVEDLEKRFREHSSQLQAYAAALRRVWPKRRLLGVAINWIAYGQMTMAKG